MPRNPSKPVAKRRCYNPGKRPGYDLLIKVADETGGQEAEYRVEWSAKLRAMMEDYAAHVVRKPFGDVEFHWCGRRLTGEETPDLVDMDWEEWITVVVKR